MASASCEPQGLRWGWAFSRGKSGCRVWRKRSMGVRQARTVASTALFPFALRCAGDSGKTSREAVSPFCLQSCFRPSTGSTYGGGSSPLFSPAVTWPSLFPGDSRWPSASHDRGIPQGAREGHLAGVPPTAVPVQRTGALPAEGYSPAEPLSPQGLPRTCLEHGGAAGVTHLQSSLFLCEVPAELSWIIKMNMIFE